MNWLTAQQEGRVVLFAALLGLLALTSPGHEARAVGTDPSLVVTGVEPFVSSSGPVSLRVSGVFHLDDLVQFSFPAGIIVSQGNAFVRYEFGGAVLEGSDASVGNGITSSEIPALLSVGSPAAPPAALAHLGNERATVVLPGGFTTGSATVLVYAILEGDPFVSNAISFTLP